MAVTINEIATKFAEVQEMIKQNLIEKLDSNGNIICLSTDDAKKMKNFTNLVIDEIGKNDDWSGGIYVKEGGKQYSFNVLNVQTQYNIIEILDNILG